MAEDHTAVLATELPECITQSPEEPASAAFLATCSLRGTMIADSIHCPSNCGGHPICRPCLALAAELGLVRDA